MNAMRLASQLGHVKTRSLNRTKIPDSSIQRQIFKYLIVIDFEATCWEVKSSHNPQSEVIEFPAVLYNTHSHAIEDVFHTYVQPTEQPILSEFCKKLTGITQDQVESGVPLGTALMLFTKWLDEKKSALNFVINDIVKDKNSATFVTWSDWDINVCLAYECKRKSVRKSVYFDAWADLRNIYLRFYQRRPQGLNGALQDLGLNFDGREHSGIADAENTAKLCGKMIKDGCVIIITKFVPGSKFVHPNLKNMTVNSATDEVKNKIHTEKSASIDHRPQRHPKRKSAGFTRTPPMCNCGRRSQLKTVRAPGPNQGRSFYACSRRRNGDSASVKTGCQFFQWSDSNEMKMKSRASKENTSAPALITTEEDLLVASNNAETAIDNETVDLGCVQHRNSLGTKQYFGNVQLFQSKPSRKSC